MHRFPQGSVNHCQHPVENESQSWSQYCHWDRFSRIPHNYSQKKKRLFSCHFNEFLENDRETHNQNYY